MSEKTTKQRGAGRPRRADNTNAPQPVGPDKYVGVAAIARKIDDSERKVKKLVRLPGFPSPLYLPDPRWLESAVDAFLRELASRGGIASRRRPDLARAALAAKRKAASESDTQPA